jgi:pimeloyl-ACP methyl ester carboxylesterase
MSVAANSVAKSSSYMALSRRLWAGTVVAAGLLLLPSLALGAGSADRNAAASHPHVYLMRGLLNIFSLGMDQMAVQLARQGIDASVYNHTLAEGVVGEIAAKYRAGDHGPYILVGHSLGADAVMTMAQELNTRGIPVALVVPFDGTGSYLAPRNVACVLNLTQREYAYMRPGAGFHGNLRNVDVSGDASIDHFTIDKSPRLQAVALNSILQAAHAESCRPGPNGPAVAGPKAAPAPQAASPAKITAPTKSASPTLGAGFEG